MPLASTLIVDQQRRLNMVGNRKRERIPSPRDYQMHVNPDTLLPGNSGKTGGPEDRWHGNMTIKNHATHITALKNNSKFLIIIVQVLSIDHFDNPLYHPLAALYIVIPVGLWRMPASTLRCHRNSKCVIHHPFRLWIGLLPIFVKNELKLKKYMSK